MNAGVRRRLSPSAARLGMRREYPASLARIDFAPAASCRNRVAAAPGEERARARSFGAADDAGHASGDAVPSTIQRRGPCCLLGRAS